MAMSMMFAMMIAMGGGDLAGDLLDFADTEMYWQIRDQRIIDVDTMSAMIDNKDATPTDKLMAIRAIGERILIMEADPNVKDDPAVRAKALKVLTPLVGSKEPFVGQYAKRSIAWIKGEVPESRPMLTNKDIASDLALLPHTSQIVGQLRVKSAVGPADWTKLIPDIKVQDGPNREQMMGEMQQGIIQAVMMVGNARVDAVTVGATFLEEDDDDGYAMIVVRGQYDRVGIQIAMQQMAEEQDDDTFSMYSIGKVEVIANKGRYEKFAMLMPSNELFIVMFGEGGGEGLGLFPIDETADLLNKGDAQVAFSKELTAQIAKIDREKSTAWAALNIPPIMKNEMDEVFGPFDTARLWAVPDKDGNQVVSWVAEGKDADAIAETVAELNEGINEGKAEMREMVQREPGMKPMFEPMIKMMDSLNVKAEGKTMTGGLTMPSGVGMMSPFMMMGMPMRAHDHGEFEAAPAVIEDVELEAVEK